MAATRIRRYCPITSTRMCLELHLGQLLGLLLEQPALVLMWVLPLQAELVLLPVLVERFLPVLAVDQM